MYMYIAVAFLFEIFADPLNYEPYLCDFEFSKLE